MIKKLRVRFIVVAMAAVLSVLVVIMAAVNTANYIKVVRSADSLLLILGENGGRFPKLDGYKDKDILKKPGGAFSPETPYETRFFSVSIDNAGNAVSQYTDSIAAVGGQDALALALEAYGSGKEKGFIGDYRFMSFPADEGRLIVFLDCGRDMVTFRSFLSSSAAVSAAGAVSVFILVFVFSGAVFRPVAESYRKQKRFITDASHELKTPLTIIDANTEIIEMENGESEWTKSIRNQTSRLAEMTSSLVTLSRMEEQENDLKTTEFSLSDAVTEASQPYLAFALSARKKLSLDVDENISYNGNEGAIRKLVSVLLDNAVKYSDDGGSISVSLKKQGRSNVLTVVNSVDSVKPGKLEEFFDRFYRGDAARSPETSGFGIGLSVAKAIVTAHKGKISAVGSDDGKQVSVNVTL